MQNNISVKNTRSKKPPAAWKKARGTSSYKAPPPSRFRRILRKIFNPWTLGASLILILIAFFTTTYFWFQFSDQIDRRLLSGVVFTPSAGIYSAPKTLRTGEQISLTELIDYLKSAGYIQKDDKADQSRSRYSVDEDGITIQPGVTGIIDGKKVFPDLRVSFNKDNKSVKNITDIETTSIVQNAPLEPKMLSTVAVEGDGRRKTVNFADIPQSLIDAITVTEDRSFFEHHGVNLRGIARAFWSRYERPDDSVLANQGGSSITQQLVKNLLLTNEVTWKRKITEAGMSVVLETKLGKEEIFGLYANQIYLGQHAGLSIYGVGEAANVYFGKDVSQLTLPESAFIAGIIRSPNRYNPYKNPERVEERRNQILQSMQEVGKISSAQYEQARNVKLVLKPITDKSVQQGMPYFSQYAIEQLPKVVSDPDAMQRLRVYTSIDPDLQKMAYETVSKRLEKLDKLFKKRSPGRLDAALVAIRPKTGEIVAMVGGRNFAENQFNRATDAMRQPGSVFKPFVYATAINSAYDTASRVFTAATVLKDEKKVFTFDQNSYAPNNYGDHFSGEEITLRDALVRSKNTITVDLGMQVNIGKVMNLAAKAGMPKVEKAYPSMALGTAEATPLQVATAYTTFANLGDRVLPMPITKVTEGDGKVIALPVPDKQQVIRPDVAYIMDDIMKDVINRGTAAQAKSWGFQNVSGKTAFAGKTGTSRDGWFAGFTPELVCVVYVGFDENGDLGLKGSDSAMPIWADFMKAALDLHPEWNGDWEAPANLRKAEIDIRNGALIRELGSVSTETPTPTPTPTPKPSNSNIDMTLWESDIPEAEPEIYVTDVPPEFRRIEWFIGGTIPNRAVLPSDDELQFDPITGEPIYPEPVSPTPSPTQTPLTGTWQEKSESQPSANSNSRTAPRTRQPDSDVRRPDLPDQ